MAAFRRAIRQFRVAAAEVVSSSPRPTVSSCASETLIRTSLRRYRALLRWVVVIEERTEAGCAVCLKVADETGLAIDKGAQALAHSACKDDEAIIN
ncbi:hypothetical protein BDQ94DRAFT_170132 [Aspergillus welwitschiae]|uniref:Uncharacterized protein n=1 Tax=Aspergillus welwitschiae TaxID=1341132 RepID=A0A3F3Q2Q1_9EURO|nr:hypothetical protein BDQ94DRAFT_170132 [Aspergillus welwitschiae]RDH33504.1 hypothetical protein BDQ94DRAFT_170132 [Aspergillus welwitschiae]GLA13619.1 hypothetical protein AnigIFM62618_010873 [Aspergillus niger]